MELKIQRIIILTVFIVLFESITLIIGWMSGFISYEPRILFGFFISSFAFGDTVLDLYYKGVEKRRFLKIHLGFYLFSGIILLIYILIYIFYQVGALELTVLMVLYLGGVISFDIFCMLKAKVPGAVNPP